MVPTDNVVAGNVIKLTGTSTTGQAVSMATMTNYNGMYEFDNLPAGTYSITETMPGNYTNGPDTVGSLGGSEKVNNVFSGIVLGTNTNGVNYNFGVEQTTGTAFTAAQTATVAFWNSNSGQTLIKELNGSSNSTSLSAWLASNYNNIYGANAGSNNLTGKTNAQVASYYQSLAIVVEPATQRRHHGPGLERICHQLDPGRHGRFVLRICRFDDWLGSCHGQRRQLGSRLRCR